MPKHKVKSFGQLRTLKLRLTRTDVVEVTRAGSHYKARFRGRSNFVFGATPEEAKQRLRSSLSRRWAISPAPITDIEHLLMKGMR